MPRKTTKNHCETPAHFDGWILKTDIFRGESWSEEVFKELQAA
jgi:hypothetical protein